MDDKTGNLCYGEEGRCAIDFGVWNRGAVLAECIYICETKSNEEHAQIISSSWST
jgi:hypothetical protein